jgi:hypothetical protein
VKTSKGAPDEESSEIIRDNHTDRFAIASGHEPNDFGRQGPRDRQIEASHVSAASSADFPRSALHNLPINGIADSDSGSGSGTLMQPAPFHSFIHRISMFSLLP